MQIAALGLDLASRRMSRLRPRVRPRAAQLGPDIASERLGR
jgi:hypothetical protein